MLHMTILFCRIYVANIVAIATQNSVFIKNQVNSLLGNQNKKIYIFGSSFIAFYVTLRLFS